MLKIVRVVVFTVAIVLSMARLVWADVYSEYEEDGTRNAFHTDPTVNSRRTDHFVIRFGPKPRQGFMVEQVYHGQMQLLEHAYDTWLGLGLHPLGGTDPTTKYKLIIEPAQTWDGDTEGTAVSFSTPIAGTSYWVPGIHIPCNSLGYKAPNGTTPHECGHNWENQNGNIPATTPQGLTESLANWLLQLQLADYPQDWVSVGMPMGHAAVGYNCLSFFNYFMDAPGYGSNFINQMVSAPNLNTAPDYLSDDLIRKAIRVDTSGAVDKAGAIHDGLGLMNAKMLNMDFWNHRVNTAYSYDQDSQRSAFSWTRIPMVRQPGVSGTWYRPEWTCIPQTLMNNFIPLTVTASGSPRTVTCDFRPVADAVRGTSFRACFVAFNQNKEARYGRLWNAGVNSFTLADDEQAVYLAIIACPKAMNAAFNHSDYTLNNVAMFPYRISLTGADPRGWQAPAPVSGFHTHTNGGGIVANTATVDASAYVGPNAMVLGTAKVYGNARIEDYALVDGSATIGRSGQSDDPVVSGHAYVTDTAQVYGHAKVRDYGWVWGAAKIYDNAIVMAHSMMKGASVFGNAVMNQAPLRDTGLNFSGSYSGSAIIGGDCSGLGLTFCDKGVWCEFPGISVADNKYQYLGYNFEKKSCVFAMDQYGMNHSYLMGEPSIVRDTVNGIATSTLNLNGTSQYVELRPDVVDFAELTIATWVKWTGSANDQRIFSTGDGNAKYMYLTPKAAATGKLRWEISDGNTVQSLNGTAALASNTWTHVAITLSNNVGTLYVNGVAVTNATITIAPDELHAPLMADWNFIGRGNSGSYFAGRVDEFRVYNRALNAAAVAALLTDISTSTAPAADTNAPTPNAATWLVNPAVSGGKVITMSATEGTDAGGNGVLYYFRCVTDSSHDSGWISENKFTDCACAPGTTYTYAVKMKDKLGNTGAESSSLSATTPAADVTAPTPNAPTFTSAPKGASTTSITMTANKAVDADETVMYKFTRLGTSITSGWTSSRTWTDTNLTSGSSYSYTLQVKDSHGNTTTTTTSAAAVARDDTAPALDTDFRLQWATYPYTQLDKTVRMYARDQVETAVDYYYECVEMPSINSGWTNNKVWVTPPMADGTYTFRFKIRDRSPQLNQSPWSAGKTSKVLPTNCYHDYSLAQLAGLSDSTLVRFTGKVTQVNSDNYVVSTADGLTNISVVPRTFGSKTDATLLNRNVNIKGHLWTYTGTPKRVTGAIVAGNPQIGKIEFENCDYDDDLARLLYDANASGSEYLGWFQPAWSVTIPNVAAANQLTLTYAGGGGTLSLYTNGVYYRKLTIPGTANNSTWGSTTITGLSITAGTALRLQQDAGDAAPMLDYMILGPTYALSGKVSNTNGVGIAGANIYISGSTNAALDPVYSTLTDASGNYTKAVPNGTWYVAACANSQAYISSADQTVVVSGSSVSNVNFTLQTVTRSFPRPSDLLFACIPEMLPDYGAAGTWVSYTPTNLSFATKGVPMVETVSGVKWEKNSSATGDGFASPTYSSPIAINGATIVAAVKPVRNTTYGYNYAIADAFFDRLSIGIENPTGRVLVKCNGSASWSSAALSDGQLTVLSLVVQPNGRYAVWANGTQIMTNATTSDMTSLVPGVPGVYAKTLSIGNNGPDGASALNGDIGDVCFYKVALTDSERQQLETSLTSKYSVASNTITASTGTGGTISPSGAVSVANGANQSFTISANSGYGIANVLVDSVSKGAIGSYTFTNVTAAHTISATFTNLPVGTGGIISVNYVQSNDLLALTNVAGVVATNHWNNVIYGGSNYQTPTNVFYDCSGASISAFTVKLSKNNWNTWNTGSGATPDKKLFSEWALDGGGTFTLTNIPYASYNLYVYFTGFGSSNVVKYGIGSVTNTLVNTMGSPNNFSGFVAGNNYTAFTNLSGSSQVMTVTGVAGVAYGVAAFQIIQNIPSNTITASAGTGGTISPSGAVLVAYGANQSFTISPNSGYAIASVLVDSVSKGAIGSYTFTNVTATHTISATFTNVPVGAGRIISVNYVQSNDLLALTNVAGVVATNHWNNIIYGGSNYQTPTNVFYDCSGSVVSGFGVTLSKNNWNTWNTGSGATPDKKLFSEWALDGGGTFTLTNIPYASYNLYVYFTGFGSSNVVKYGIGNVTNTLVNTMGSPNNFSGFVAGNNYTAFTNLSGSSQVMTVTGISGVAYGVSAFQIVENETGQQSIGAGILPGVLNTPALTITQDDHGGFIITWPDTYSSQLLWSPKLGSEANWQPFEGTPIHTNGIYQLSVPFAAGTAFYRMNP